MLRVYRFEIRFTQHDFEGAAFVATQQKSRERVLQVALCLFAGVTLRMDIEQVARGNEPFPFFFTCAGNFNSIEACTQSPVRDVS